MLLHAEPKPIGREISSQILAPPPLQQLVETRSITSHFQPIFSIRGKSVVGMEALSRGISPTGDLIPPAVLFKLARTEGLAGPVETLCRQTAVKSFANLRARPEDLLLFLNLDLATTPHHERLPGELEAMVRRAGLRPRNVAVEFLEARVDDVERFGALAVALRQRGFLVVLDDVGAGHSNLDRIPLIRPDIIKIDRSLITGVDADFYKQETFKSLVSLSRRIGALVVAEGIETEREAVAALELGADLLQGYFLSRPRPAPCFGGAGLVEAATCVDTLAQTFKNHMVGEINRRKLAHRRLNVILDRLLCELTSADAGAFGSVLARVIGDYDKIECCYVLDDAGVQVTETICGAAITGRPGEEMQAMFRPAAPGTDHSLKEYYYVLVDVELAKFTTDPYVSLASGNLCRTISTCFRDAADSRIYVLCVDVKP
jgi:EAL domain-containing protein (putative c-di-GMP-specific phosphodiesterase class I)